MVACEEELVDMRERKTREKMVISKLHRESQQETASVSYREG